MTVPGMDWVDRREPFSFLDPPEPAQILLIETVLQYSFATPKLLKPRRLWD